MSKSMYVVSSELWLVIQSPQNYYDQFLFHVIYY